MLEDKVLSASSEELTLMLYDGALKFCNQAIMAVEKKDYNKAHPLIMRVEDIIREFQITLNHSYEISKQLNVLYDYIYRRLVDANMAKDVSILNEVRDLLRDLRDTWKEAIRLSRQK
jgi:flagellar protein FliS